jgi:hypothetical protein
MKNPEALVVLERDSEFYGYFSILALTRSGENKFQKGQIVENEIVSSHVLASNYLKQSKAIYISGIVLINSKDFVSSKILFDLMAYYIRKKFDDNNLAFVYTIPYTSIGEKYCSKFGFEIHESKNSRKDKHPLYRLKINSEKGKEFREYEIDKLNDIDLAIFDR